MSRWSFAGKAAITAAAALGLGFCAFSSSADTVHLANGKRFEDVDARVEGSAVILRIDGGEIRLPNTAVARIEESPSGLETFERRRRGLEEGVASQAEWLELGRWALRKGLSRAAAEAGLRAASLDPTVSEVKAFLASLDYLYDEDTGRYLPEREWMRAKGRVLDGGEWVTAEVLAQREAARVERLRATRADQDREQWNRALQLLLLAELKEREQPPVGLPIYSTAIVGVPVAPRPHPYVGGSHRHAGIPWSLRPAAPGWTPFSQLDPVRQDLVRRIPGSRLPLGGGQVHRSSRAAKPVGGG